MCHLRGLAAECGGRGYAAGVNEYLSVVKYFFKKKEFPQKLIDLNLNKFSSVKKINATRQHAENILREIGISKAQAVCLLYSPIAEKGKNLHKYLKEQAPEFLAQESKIKDFLSGNDCVNNKIIKFLLINTGLKKELLRHLYLSPLFYPIQTSTNEHKNDQNNYDNIFNSIIKYDHHQKEVECVDENGKEINEIIFGR